MASMGTMYKVNKHYDIAGSVEQPKVMYHVNRQYANPNDQQTGGPATLEERQEVLLKKLDSLIAVASSRLGETSSGSSAAVSSPALQLLSQDCPLDIVIRADAARPPRWLGQVKKQLEDKGIPTWWKFHTHSSVKTAPSSEIFPLEVRHEDRHRFKLIVTVVWTAAGPTPSLHINPCLRTAICGETNIFRFFGRLLGVYDVSPIDDATIDLCLYNCDVILDQSSKQKGAVLKSVAKSVEKGTLSNVNDSGLLSAFLVSILVGFGLDNVPAESLKTWARENGSLLIFT